MCLHHHYSGVFHFSLFLHGFSSTRSFSCNRADVALDVPLSSKLQPLHFIERWFGSSISDTCTVEHADAVVFAGDQEPPKGHDSSMIFQSWWTQLLFLQIYYTLLPVILHIYLSRSIQQSLLCSSWLAHSSCFRSSDRILCFKFRILSNQ